ncbi:hypothetical protein B0H14DRAFT_3773461 [Mycena olivaceomarginata]|nr:hypothetical protein B0H14DRAFT_3773461 [Mycena olivaceomarginata]
MNSVFGKTQDIFGCEMKRSRPSNAGAICEFASLYLVESPFDSGLGQEKFPTLLFIFCSFADLASCPQNRMHRAQSSSPHLRHFVTSLMNEKVPRHFGRHVRTFLSSTTTTLNPRDVPDAPPTQAFRAQQGHPSPALNRQYFKYKLSDTRYFPPPPLYHIGTSTAFADGTSNLDNELKPKPQHTYDTADPAHSAGALSVPAPVHVCVVGSHEHADSDDGGADGRLNRAAGVWQHFHTAEQALYAQLATTPVGALNDVWRTFMIAAKGAGRPAWVGGELAGLAAAGVNARSAEQQEQLRVIVFLGKAGVYGVDAAAV